MTSGTFYKLKYKFQFDPFPIRSAAGKNVKTFFFVLHCCRYETVIAAIRPRDLLQVIREQKYVQKKPGKLYAHGDTIFCSISHGIYIHNY